MSSAFMISKTIELSHRIIYVANIKVVHETYSTLLNTMKWGPWSVSKSDRAVG